MVRVLVDGSIYGLQRHGGISRCFTETLSRVGRYVPDIDVLLHLPGGSSSGPREPWIHPIRDLRTRPARLFGAVSRAAARARRPRLFHASYYGAPYWGGLRSVVTVYDLIHERLPAMLPDPAFVARKRQAIEQADALIAISESVKAEVVEYAGLPDERVTVMPLGVSDSFLASPPPAEECAAFRRLHGIGDPYWLFVGKRGLYKNFGTLLRAFAQIAERSGGHLVAAGGEPSLDGWEIDFVVRNRLEGRVHVLPGVSDEELRCAYTGAAGFVFPSLAEGFGVPLLEAMACGAPVLASDIPVFREVAGDSALWFDPHEREAVADAMLTVLDRWNADDLAARGRERVKQFSWDAAAMKLGEVYRALA